MKSLLDRGRQDGWEEDVAKIWGVTVWTVCVLLIPIRTHPQSYPVEQSVSLFLRARVNQGLQGCTCLKHPPFRPTIGRASHLEEVPSLDLRYPPHLPSDGGALTSIHTELPFSFC